MAMDIAGIGKAQEGGPSRTALLRLSIGRSILLGFKPYRPHGELFDRR
jgi:hypothetical protein